MYRKKYEKWDFRQNTTLQNEFNSEADLESHMCQHQDFMTKLMWKLNEMRTSPRVTEPGSDPAVNPNIQMCWMYGGCRSVLVLAESRVECKNLMTSFVSPKGGNITQF